LEDAAGLVCGSMDVELPMAAPMMVVSFRHRDKTLVRPVVAAIIETYTRRHNEVNNPENDLYKSQQEELQQKLEVTQRKLADILVSNKVISIQETKKVLQEQQTHWQNELRNAQLELAAAKAALSEGAQAALAPGATNSVTVPAEVSEESLGLGGRVVKMHDA